MATTVNLKLGLPATVDVRNPDELQAVMEAVLEALRTWNGEIDPGKRVVTKDELDAAVP